MSTEKPVVLSCGDPAGIGPEISLLAWRETGGDLPFCLLGDAGHFPRGSPVAVIQDIAETARAARHGLPVLHHGFAHGAIPGKLDPANAQDIIDMIALGCSLVRSGKASALCTNPINKKLLRDGAGFEFPGHTEFLASLTDSKRPVMMLACEQLRVVPVTIHMALRDVAGALDADILADTIRITHDALITRFALPEPRIAVAGLNPHAGEGGAMGDEEIELITPVLDRLRAQGLNLTGPMSADTMFHAAARARYDVAIAMYHDQALIPIKTLAFDAGVNVTLGLPIIRTSPDHGTAVDIAGKGLADPGSLIAALKMAHGMAGQNRP